MVYRSARPARTVVVTPGHPEDWGEIATGVLSSLSLTWGGLHDILVPVTGSGPHPAFAPIVKAFDPDWISTYRVTSLDVPDREADGIWFIDVRDEDVATVVSWCASCSTDRDLHPWACRGRAVQRPLVPLAAFGGAWWPEVLDLDLSKIDPFLALMVHRHIADALPESSVALAPVAAVIYGRIVATPDTSNREHVADLVSLSNWLAALGRRDEALDAIDEAVTACRQLAVEHPAASVGILAKVLNNQANRLYDVGRRENADAAIREAVALYRQLAEADPDSFRADFARALNNQSGHLAHLGQKEEALAAATQALAIRRQLAESSPNEFLADLAGSLNNQSVHFVEPRPKGRGSDRDRRSC
jgi:hypothetical protein